MKTLALAHGLLLIGATATCLASPSPEVTLQLLEDRLNSVRVGNLFGDVDYEFVYSARPTARNLVLMEAPLVSIGAGKRSAPGDSLDALPDLRYPALRFSDLPADLQAVSVAEVREKIRVPAVFQGLTAQLAVRPFKGHLEDTSRRLTTTESLSMAQRRVLVSKYSGIHMAWPAGARLILSQKASALAEDKMTVTVAVEWSFRRPLVNTFSEPLMQGTTNVVLIRSGEDWLVANVEDLIESIYQALGA